MDHKSDAVRGQYRRKGFRRLSHGLFLPVRENLDAYQEFLRDLEAWRLVLPPDAVFTHITGAKLLGWQLPSLPEQVPVFAAVRGPTTPRRAGLICSRVVRRDGCYRGGAHPVDWPEEICLRAARDLGVADLVIMLDSALRRGHIDSDRMESILASRRPGVVNLRRAWALADRRSESAGESILRLFHVFMQIPVEPQVVLRDHQQHVVARVDLLVQGTHLAHEYDGAGHRDGRQHTRNLRRDRALIQLGYQRQGFTLSDIVVQPAVTMHQLDRILGRRQELRRLKRWHAVLRESFFTRPGRDRVMNRWDRMMGLHGGHAA